MALNLQVTRFTKEESGSSLIEFGFAASLLFLVIFGIMDCCRAIYADHFCAQSARDATRFAMVRGATWTGTPCNTAGSNNCAATGTDIVNYVKGLAPSGITPSSVSVIPTWPGTTVTGDACSTVSANTSPGCVVNVTVNYSFNFTLPFLPQNALVLSSTSAVTISQ